MSKVLQWRREVLLNVKSKKILFSVEPELSEDILGAVEDGLDRLVVKVGAQLGLEEVHRLLQGGAVLERERVRVRSSQLDFIPRFLTCRRPPDPPRPRQHQESGLRCHENLNLEALLYTSRSVLSSNHWKKSSKELKGQLSPP